MSMAQLDGYSNDHPRTFACRDSEAGFDRRWIALSGYVMTRVPSPATVNSLNVLTRELRGERFATMPWEQVTIELTVLGMGAVIACLFPNHGYEDVEHMQDCFLCLQSYFHPASENPVIGITTAADQPTTGSNYAAVADEAITRFIQVCHWGEENDNLSPNEAIDE